MSRLEHPTINYSRENLTDKKYLTKFMVNHDIHFQPVNNPPQDYEAHVRIHNISPERKKSPIHGTHYNPKVTLRSLSPVNNPKTSQNGRHADTSVSKKSRNQSPPSSSSGKVKLPKGHLNKLFEAHDKVVNNPRSKSQIRQSSTGYDKSYNNEQRYDNVNRSREFVGRKAGNQTVSFDLDPSNSKEWDTERYIRIVSEIIADDISDYLLNNDFLLKGKSAANIKDCITKLCIDCLVAYELDTQQKIVVVNQVVRSIESSQVLNELTRTPKLGANKPNKKSSEDQSYFQSNEQDTGVNSKSISISSKYSTATREKMKTILSDFNKHIKNADDDYKNIWQAQSDDYSEDGRVKVKNLISEGQGNINELKQTFNPEMVQNEILPKVLEKYQQSNKSEEYKKLGNQGFKSPTENNGPLAGPVNPNCSVASFSEDKRKSVNSTKMSEKSGSASGSKKHSVASNKLNVTQNQSTSKHSAKVSQEVSTKNGANKKSNRNKSRSRTPPAQQPEAEQSKEKEVRLITFNEVETANKERFKTLSTEGSVPGNKLVMQSSLEQLKKWDSKYTSKPKSSYIEDINDSFEKHQSKHLDFAYAKALVGDGSDKLKIKKKLNEYEQIYKQKIQQLNATFNEKINMTFNELERKTDRSHSPIFNRFASDSQDSDRLRIQRLKQTEERYNEFTRQVLKNNIKAYEKKQSEFLRDRSFEKPLDYQKLGSSDIMTYHKIVLQKTNLHTIEKGRKSPIGGRPEY